MLHSLNQIWGGNLSKIKSLDYIITISKTWTHIKRKGNRGKGRGKDQRESEKVILKEKDELKLLETSLSARSCPWNF